MESERRRWCFTPCAAMCCRKLAKQAGEHVVADQAGRNIAYEDPRLAATRNGLEIRAEPFVHLDCDSEQRQAAIDQRIAVTLFEQALVAAEMHLARLEPGRIECRALG